MSRELNIERAKLVIAIIVLIGLIFAIIYLLFYSDPKKVKLDLPELPKEGVVEVGIVDFSESGSDSLDLNNNKTKEASVEYISIDDYYKEGIMLGGNIIESINSNFILRSSSFAQPAFVSLINKDMKLEWIAKIEDKKYKSIYIRKVLFVDNYYYVFAEGLVDTTKYLLGIKIGTDGKSSGIKEIIKLDNFTINDSFYVNDNFTVVSGGYYNLIVYTIDKEFKVVKEYREALQLNSVFHNDAITIRRSGIDENLIYMEIFADETENLVVFNVENDEIKRTEIDVNNRAETVLFSNRKTKLFDQNKVYVYKLNDEIINRFDYSQVTLEPVEDYPSYVTLDGEDLKNALGVLGMTETNDYYIVNFETTFNKYYDVFDKSLNIKKRFKINKEKYSYKEQEAIMINYSYYDNKLYEFYIYGNTTPSLMVSVVNVG